MITEPGKYRFYNEYYDFDFITDNVVTSERISAIITSYRKLFDHSIFPFVLVTRASDVYKYSKLIETYPITFSLQKEYPEYFI